MRNAKTGILVTAGALLALLTLTGAVSPQCTPLPVEPVCTTSADCPEGEFCTSEGRCASFTACDADSDCVKVSAGCCPCSMGGSDWAISEDWVDEWEALFDCSPDISCPAVYLCDDTVPACVDGECALVDPEPLDVCSALEQVYPDSARACAYDAECTVVLHQINCCGSMAAWGINVSAAEGFARAEEECRAYLPQCGCPAYPPVADDGNSAWDTDGIAAQCVNGACQSYVVAP